MDRKNHTLLIVDSSASHRFYLGTMLRRLEYTVRGANSSEDALQLMATILPSLVITDFALPDMNGIDLLMKMRQDQRLKTVPVIIQSADDGPGMRERCMTAGCLTYFKKPAEIDDLYRAIQEALESSPRKTVRIDTAFKVQVGDKNAPGGFVRRESITDLSDGGLFISTLTPDPVKTVLPLTLFIEDRVIEVTAVVMFVSKKIDGQNQGAGMGMKFVSIEEKDRVFIRNYIKKQLSQDLSV
jgi:CheY-like chemotaxis protein